MSFPFLPSVHGIAWDACELLNLLATGQEVSILRSLALPSYVARLVADTEVLSLRPYPASTANIKEAVSLKPLIDSGLLSVADLDPAETVDFVRIAADLDDGESALAFAAQRGFIIATNDRQTLGWIRRQLPAQSYMTTPDWLRHWAQVTGASHVTISDAVQRVVTRARYRPKNHALQSWWDKYDV